MFGLEVSAEVLAAFELDAVVLFGGRGFDDGRQETASAHGEWFGVDVGGGESSVWVAVVVCAVVVVDSK